MNPERSRLLCTLGKAILKAIKCLLRLKISVEEGIFAALRDGFRLGHQSKHLKVRPSSELERVYELEKDRGA